MHILLENYMQNIFTQDGILYSYIQDSIKTSRNNSKILSQIIFRKNNEQNKLKQIFFLKKEMPMTKDNNSNYKTKTQTKKNNEKKIKEEKKMKKRLSSHPLHYLN